jgi:hypothetical protein
MRVGSVGDDGSEVREIVLSRPLLTLTVTLIKWLLSFSSAWYFFILFSCVIVLIRKSQTNRNPARRNNIIFVCCVQEQKFQNKYENDSGFDEHTFNFLGYDQWLFEVKTIRGRTIPHMQ